jgi:type 1 glutamine amidotransferase
MDMTGGGLEMTHMTVLLAGGIFLLAASALRAAEVRMPTEDELKKVEQAAPAEPAAKPAAPRKVLVWGRLAAHDPNPIAAKTMEILGKKSGAFQAVVSQEPAALLAESLKGFDAILINNVHEPDPFLPKDLAQRPAAEQEALKKQNEAIHQAILEFVRGGKGIAGIHAATAAFGAWPEYGRLMGGFYGAHIAQEVPIKLDEPDHPLNAAFGGKGFKINDEIYIFRDPYSRRELRVLLSLDLSEMADPGKRPDKDYAVSWVRDYGKGRVFYCSLGHANATYWNPLFLRHVLAGIQFAIGDLKADAAPRNK